jgi:hypothetical protein
MRRPVPALLAVLLALGGRALAADEGAVSEYLGGRMPYARFDQLPATALALDGGTVRVAFAPGPLGQPREALLAWTRRSAAAVAGYLGGFPVKDLRVLFVGIPGDEVHGTTWSYRGPATRMLLGREASEAEVLGSWVLTHELVHSAIPDLDDAQLWLAEGLATYVEPIARAQAGELPVEQVWRWLLEGLPRGLPAPGDRGLDHTHTWGRTYWGGALFCLLAEVELRERTGNRKGLQDALRAARAAGASSEVAWTVERYLQVADAGVGVAVLRPLYEKWKATPVTPDLPALWRRLGVSLEGGQVRFDDRAPLAAARRSITAPR